MKTYKATIAGTSALLQHRFTEAAQNQKQTRNALVTEQSPREQAQACAYQLPNGTYYLPGAAIARLLREAGGGHKLRGTRKSAKYVVPAAVLVTEDTITVLDGDAETPASNFEVDSRPVTIPATKGRIMRHRPRFDSWAATFSIRINEDILPQDFVHRLLVEGGQQLGVGDFRPEKGGPFGTFNVIEWRAI
jgi:hypothetical protein